MALLWRCILCGCGSLLTADRGALSSFPTSVFCAFANPNLYNQTFNTIKDLLPRPHQQPISVSMPHSVGPPHPSFFGGRACGADCNRAGFFGVFLAFSGVPLSFCSAGAEADTVLTDDELESKFSAEMIESEMPDMLKLLDVDGDGDITPHEIRLALDSNGDGVISITEFIREMGKLIKKHQHQQPAALAVAPLRAAPPPNRFAQAPTRAKPAKLTNLFSGHSSASAGSSAKIGATRTEDDNHEFQKFSLKPTNGAHAKQKTASLLAPAASLTIAPRKSPATKRRGSVVRSSRGRKPLPHMCIVRGAVGMDEDLTQLLLLTPPPRSHCARLCPFR